MKWILVALIVGSTVLADLHPKVQSAVSPLLVHVWAVCNTGS